MSNGFRDHQAPTSRELEKRTKGAVERINNLEQNFERLVPAINNVMTDVSKRLAMTEEMMAACVEVIGLEDVQAALNKNREKAIANQVEQMKSTIDVAVKDGKLVTATAINEKSIIVGVERDTDGKPLVPGRVQVQFANVQPEIKEKLLGKGVGETIPTSPKDAAGKDLPAGTFEVTEIYDIVEQTVGLVAPANEEAPTPPEAA